MDAYTNCRQFNCITPIVEQTEYHMFCREKPELYMPELYHKIGVGKIYILFFIQLNYRSLVPCNSIWVKLLKPLADIGSAREVRRVKLLNNANSK